jgi:RNA polymerase sigma-70 factor (ECF subfamily)
MAADQSYSALIGRLRGGDEAAAAELVRQYEPEVRRAIRLRLNDPRLRRVLDSTDICQSVLANFFARVAGGQFDLDQPEQLVKLLVTMAHNKVLDQARHQQAQRRDSRRTGADGGAALDAVAAAGDTPSQIVAGRELLQALYAHLTDDERYLAEQRAAGREWAELASELGGSAEALRKKLSRAVGRAARHLGLDEVADA